MDVASRFQQLVREFKMGTRHLSNPNTIYRHPAYQEILSLGPAAIPLILDELQRHGGWWFDALHDLTGKSPATPGATVLEGGFYKMSYEKHRAAWLSWGRARGLLT